MKSRLAAFQDGVPAITSKVLGLNDSPQPPTLPERILLHSQRRNFVSTDLPHVNFKTLDLLRSNNINISSSSSSSTSLTPLILLFRKTKPIKGLFYLTDIRFQCVLHMF